MKDLESKDEDDMKMSDLTKVMKMTTKIAALASKAEEMDCDLERDIMDSIEEEASDSESMEEGEAEDASSEEESTPEDNE